jgi:hypothetical protein
MRQLERLGAPGHSQPRGLPGEPERNLGARCKSRGGHGERLRATFRVVRARGALDDERTDRWRAHADILPVMEATYLVILIVTFLAIAAMSVYIVAKLFAGQR